MMNMKRKSYLTIVGICLLTIFSFYYTNKIIEFSKSKDLIMIEIMNNKDNYNKISIDALINNNYITPGSEGLEVDIDKSYNKMKKLGKYNENLYVYNIVKPTISIKDNYDKFVINGNITKKEVSLVFKAEDLKNIENINKILFNNNVSATFFIDGSIKDDDINILKILDESNNYFGNLGYNKKYSIKTIKYTNALLDRIDDDNHNYCYVEKDDINVLIIRVPPASFRYRPVYIGTDMLKGTYRRDHTGDYRCMPEEVKRMLADSLPDKPDSLVLEHSTIEDLDLPTLDQYRNILRSVKPMHPFLTLDNLPFLQRLGAWKVNRATGTYGLTAAGLLMFGKTQSIQEFFPDYHVDYQEISNQGSRWIDRIYPDGTWEANLFQFFHRVWPKLSFSLPKPFLLENGRRRDEGAIHEALREAFANSIIHADYRGQGGIVIKKYPDRFLFVNPGYMLVPLEQYYKGGCSVPRNTTIQTMFSLLGYGEKAGSGSLRIMSAWASAHWRKPFISMTNRPDRVCLDLKMEVLLPKDSLEHLEYIFGKDVRNMYGDALVILSTAEIEGVVSNLRLQGLLNKHSSEISIMLKDLCSQGYLNPENKGRWTSYHLNKGIGLKQGSLFENLDGHLNEKMDTSDKKDGHLGRNMQEIKSSELKSYIVEICSSRYLTIEEIAVKTRRTSKYLKNKIVSQLLKDGLLERLYPTTPNHPNQAYKKKQQ